MGSDTVVRLFDSGLWAFTDKRATVGHSCYQTLHPCIFSVVQCIVKWDKIIPNWLHFASVVALHTVYEWGKQNQKNPLYFRISQQRVSKTMTKKYWYECSIRRKHTHTHREISGQLFLSGFLCVCVCVCVCVLHLQALWVCAWYARVGKTLWGRVWWQGVNERVIEIVVS